MPDSRMIIRDVIGVDDQWHTLTLTGPIVHVATRDADYVEVWHIHDPAGESEIRAFRVVGTGQPLAPALATHVGTAITPSGRFAWHLMEHARSDLPELDGGGR